MATLPSFAVGDVVDGRYELRRDLGRGAAGVVFEARHCFTGRRVALKIVAPEIRGTVLAEVRARLVREARALAALHHPGIVQVLDGGVVDGETPYIVMERLEGRTLEGLLATRRTLSVDDTIAIGIQLCDALDTAHAAGIVHRDVKPSNVFVVRDADGQERVKLVDFGIAQIHREVGDDPKLTGMGALIGTPAYMCPEQLLALDVDHRADIYALGTTLFECLTGRVPYEGSYQRVLLQVCGPMSPPPDLAGLCPGLDGALVEVVMKAIARSRDERFASALEFMRALHGSTPNPRTRTTFLGPPPLPKFASASQARKVPDQRRSPRAMYSTPIRIVSAQGDVDGRSEDISEGGLLVLTSGSCEPDTRVSVRFALPIEGKVVSCDARVRWVRPARPGSPAATAMGLEFVSLAPDVRSSIAAYVQLMASEGKP